jgi:proteasome lid subunit RPN8/RPN11
MDKIIISNQLWTELMLELKKRGNGSRESAAFLLGQPGSSRISKYILLDDLDPMAFNSGIIRFASSGFVELWKICEREKIKVFADVHTHPGEWTGQSSADEKHPMIHQAGHLALIIPFFASKIQKSLKGIGVYEYLGSGNWKTHLKKSKVFSIEKEK